MNAINLAPSVSTIEANPSFVFTSPHRSIKAFGIAERICLSACGAAHSDSFLQTAVQGAINRARQAGQENPIVAGAIPFDIRQPCSLFVPMSYTDFARGSLMVEERRSERAPTVLGMRSLPDKDAFKDAVTRAITSFRAGKMSKAVLSRILEIELAQPVDVAAILNALVKQNPSGYHFKAPLGDGAILLGASPELLIRKDGAAIRSNPLAGSAKRRSDPEEDRLASRKLLQSNKDNFEHRLVVDEIQEALEPVCKALTTPTEPALMNTSTMWHLSTLINRRAGEPPHVGASTCLPSASDASGLRLSNRRVAVVDWRSGAIRPRRFQRRRRMVRFRGQWRVGGGDKVRNGSRQSHSTVCGRRHRRSF